MLKNLSQYNIILGSDSPRRKKLLSGLDLEYKVEVLPYKEEFYPKTLQKEEIPVYFAQAKAKIYKEQMKNDTLLITADTIVWLDGKVYGKPINKENAKEMLRALSGKTHEVITGVCLTTCERQKTFYSVSSVRFAVLEEEEIKYYIREYQPYDKAGAYGIQEWIGFVGVESLNGSFYNVMGLPVKMLYENLKKW